MTANRIGRIGEERVFKGYLFRKIRNSGPKKGMWRKSHYINWESVNGPVPKDHVLKCLDGNKTNADASNWTAIPKGLLVHLNGTPRGDRPAYDSAPEELKPSILLAARTKFMVLRIGPTILQRSFLERLRRSKTTNLYDLTRCPRGSAEDHARRACRSNGWAKFGRWAGDRRFGWRLTSSGRAALSTCRANSN
jgi:hypothetical protein